MDAPGPERLLRQPAGQLGILFAQVFHAIGSCRLPVNIGPTLASELFSGWNVLTDLRLDAHEWVLASNDPAVKEYFGVVSRNVARARVRSVLGKPRRQLGPDELPCDAEGNVITEPSDDEMLPPVSEERLLSQTPLPVLGPAWNAFGNPTAPEREPQCAPPTEPDSKVVRMEGASCAKDDLAFTQRRAMGPSPSQLITVSKEQSKRAAYESTCGWQTYSAPFPDGNPTEVAHGPAFVPKSFRNLEGSHGWVLGKAMDSHTAALEAAKAGRVDPGDFRTLGENASLLGPLI